MYISIHGSGKREFTIVHQVERIPNSLEALQKKLFSIVSRHVEAKGMAYRTSHLVSIKDDIGQELRTTQNVQLAWIQSRRLTAEFNLTYRPKEGGLCHIL
ncbi:MAG: hypothetical protein S4CHLAM81_07560 [Chlamydiales bacterium]|nr:hypothetical protein [Chlamydiales bacterium]MCH9635539.1 hypothetical protein [Chlamydiales bacterium]